ncbi:MAG TPA: hypothetical protein VHZ55_17440 [Bryobacteraceae bacterium]|nr:hypothetical protein [Bryobacteraceae bacterium]
MPTFITLSRRADEQPGAVGSLADYRAEILPLQMVRVHYAIVALLAVNIFVVSGAICFSLLYFCG